MREGLTPALTQRSAVVLLGDLSCSARAVASSTAPSGARSHLFSSTRSASLTWLRIAAESSILFRTDSSLQSTMHTTHPRLSFPFSLGDLSAWHTGAGSDTPEVSTTRCAVPSWPCCSSTASTPEIKSSFTVQHTHPSCSLTVFTLAPCEPKLFFALEHPPVDQLSLSIVLASTLNSARSFTMATIWPLPSSTPPPTLW